MFLVLVIINIPVYIICYQNTEQNSLNNLEDLLVYYSFGNLGRPDLNCGFTDFDSEEPFQIKCGGTNFIEKLDYFGFLYAYDLKTLDRSSGEATCH